jgi:hypothetical protein
MSSPTLRLLSCLAIALCLAGCGGGSNSSTGPTGPTGPTGGPTTVTYTFSAYGVPPTAVATKIGTGSFTAATASAGKVTLTIPTGQTNYSVAWICPPPFGNDPTENEEYIREASTLDGTSFTEECYSAIAATAGLAHSRHARAHPAATGFSTVNAEVDATAITGANYVSIYYQPMPWSSGPIDFSLTLANGTYDIPVTATGNNLSFPTYQAVKILRNQTIPGSLNGGDPIVFQASDQTVSQPVTFKNIPDGFTTEALGVDYQAADGLYFDYISDNPPTQYQAMPSSIFQTGDFYAFDAVAKNATTSQTVYVSTFTSTGGPQSFTFPAPWSYSGPTPLPLPTFNFVYSGFTGSTGQEASIEWSVSPTQGTYVFDSIDLNATANYQNGATSMTIPDLSGITGFLASPASGTGVSWTAAIGQGNPFAKTPPSGSESGVTTTGGYNVP